MPVSQKKFSGIMNLDDANDVLPATHHKEAHNVVFRGNGTNQMAQSVFGNIIRDNDGDFELPFGTNSCIGSHYDQINNKLFYFNYNSNDEHGIYIFDTQSKVISTLFLVGVDSDTDILNFDIEKPITSVNIIYGADYDSVKDTGGNILYWIDSLGRPSKLNIDRKIAGVYTTYLRSYLDVAKAPPIMTPKSVFESSANLTTGSMLSASFVTNTYVSPQYLGISIASSTYFVGTLGDTNIQYTGTFPNTVSMSISVGFNVTMNPPANQFTLSVKKNNTTVVYTETRTVPPVLTTLTFNFNVDDIAVDVNDTLGVYINADATYEVTGSSTFDVTGGIAAIGIPNNNLKNTLCQFIARYVYDDNEKSVWSSGSTVALPYFPNKETISSNAAFNSRLNVFFPTGDETVRGIELAVKTCSNNFISDYQLIRLFEKNSIEEPVSDNTVHNYLFYNSTVLTPLDQQEVVQLYDYVPQEANAQELLNGNVLVYGGITEGYDLIKNTDAELSVNTTSSFNDIPGLLFFAEQGGLTSDGNTNSINVYLYGTGQNDSNGNPVSVYNALGASFMVKLKIGNTNYQVLYNSSTTTNVNAILTNLANNAISQGFTAVVSGNKLTISSASTLTLQSSYATTNLSATPFSTDYVYNELYVDQLSSNYKYGIVYYDEKGRTNGVTTSNTLKAITPAWSADTLFPIVSMSINHQPPDWAKYYHIVRSENLTYEKLLYWVSSRAFSKMVTYATSPNEFSVAYIGIGNMAFYNEDIQSTSGYVNYDYAPGDRIKFLAKISATGSKYVYTASKNLDFEIIGTEVNPNINGYVAEGNYIKIKYPAGFVDANFEFYGPDPINYVGSGVVVQNFQNYEVVIYSLKKQSENADVYYEIGQQYAIANAGTVNRYHVGQTQSQVVGSQPAIVQLIQGDYFFRFRNVPIGQSYSFAAGNYVQNTGSGNAKQYSTVVTNVQDSQNVAKTVSTTEYDIKSQILPTSACNLLSTGYPTYSATDFTFYNKSVINQTVRLRGTLSVTTYTEKQQYVVLHAKIVTNSTVLIQPIIPKVSLPTTNTKYDIPFDVSIKVPTTAKMFIMSECDPTNSNPLQVNTFTLQLDVTKNATIGIIESSFSDVVKMEITPNSRPVIYDANAKRDYQGTLVRWGLPFNFVSGINQSNRFYYQNEDYYDIQKGDIQRFKVRGNQLRVFQNRSVGVAGILENMIFNADGNDNLIQTNKILNQIHYYQGDYGLGGLTTSIASSSSADYFVDPIRGYQVRLAQDGMTPISELYKAQFYMTDLATKYSKQHTGTLGGYAKVLGTYNFYEEEYISVFQGYSGQLNNTLAFNEYRNCYTSFYDYAPEWITSAEGTVITFKNGQLYTHDNTEDYSTFYNVGHNPNITFVFNEQNMLKKDFNAITQDASSAWLSSTNGDITTTLNQSSNLVSSDYEIMEGLYNAAFMRDVNSLGGIIEGDYLKGTWLQIKLTNTSGNLVYLSGLYINYTVSQRNG